MLLDVFAMKSRISDAVVVIIGFGTRMGAGEVLFRRRVVNSCQFFRDSLHTEWENKTVKRRSLKKIIDLSEIVGAF